MGSRGPAPTPSNVLRLRGSDIPGRRERRDEPQLPSVAPRPPRGLTADARGLWRDYVRLVGPDGLAVLTLADVPALAELCELKAAWLRARDVFAAAPDRNALRDWLRLHDSVSRLEIQFGLTPSARARVQSIPSTRAEDEDESL